MIGDLLPVTDNKSGKSAFMYAIRPSARMNGLFVLLGCSSTLEVFRSGGHRPCLRGFKAVVMKERGPCEKKSRKLGTRFQQTNKQTNKFRFVGVSDQG